MPDAAPTTKTSTTSGLRAAVATLKIPYFSIYWVHNIASTFGFVVLMVVKQWLITGLTGSRTVLGVVGFIGGVSGLIASPLAGVASDRMPKRTVLLVARVLLLAVMVVEGFLVWTNAIQIWMMAVTSLFLGIVSAVQQPASQTFVYDIVGPARVQNAIGLNSAAMGVATMSGPAVAGAIIGAVGIVAAYSSIAAIMLACIVVLATIPILGRPAPGNKQTPFADLKEGFVYIWGNKPLLLVVVATTMSTFIGAREVMRPVFARFVLDAGSTGFGIMAAVNGAGAVLGALLLGAVLPPIRRPGLSIPLGLFANGFLTVLYSFAPNLPYVLVVEFCIGMTAQVWGISVFAGVQSAVPAHLRGRVLSVMFMVVQLSIIGGLIVGMLADAFGDRMALRICGIIPMVFLGGLLLWKWRTLYQLRAECPPTPKPAS